MKTLFKILLVNPMWENEVSGKGNRYNRKFPPVDLLTIGAMLRAEGHHVKLYDANAGFVEEEFSVLIKLHDLIIITSTPYYKWQCPNLNYEVFCSFCSRIPKEKAVLYGSHVSQYPDLLMGLTGFSYAVSGEPEKAVVELIGEIGNNKLNTGSGGYHLKRSSSPAELNDLPLPAFNLITEPEKYNYEILGSRIMTIEATRGCPYQCIYCYKKIYGKKVRKKSSVRIFKEINTAMAAGFNKFYIYDLEFTLHRDIVIELCGLIINSGLKIEWTCQGRVDSVDEEMLDLMKKSGCTLIHYGVESGSDRILELIKKKTDKQKIIKGFNLTKKAGIRTAAFFMFGFPTETDDERNDTISFAVKLEPDYASFHIASIYPDTEFHKIYLEEGGDKKIFYPECLSTEFDIEHLDRFKRKAYMKFYFRFTFLLKQIFTGNPVEWYRQFKLFLSFIR